jgi:hypothetical protein
MLVGQALDRFARGAGDAPGAARHLVELWHELRRRNVHLRTFEHDENIRDSALRRGSGPSRRDREPSPFAFDAQGKAATRQERATGRRSRGRRLHPDREGRRGRAV